MGENAARRRADYVGRDVDGDRDGHVSSERMRRHDIGDPVAVVWFVDQLGKGVLRPGPLDPGLSYVANLVRRHVAHRDDDARRWRTICHPRLVPALDELAARTEHLACMSRTLEHQIGDAITDMLRCPDRTRALVQLLSALQHQLDELTAAEIDIALSEAWDDIGGSG